ncbi:hypothetical protein CBM2599_B20093 [Cupriavidus taiwanensis]|nr:hypothetical protein CBM2599_B20093 [Cupriavidus taiwanensis]SOY98557.1 hypothetical protein CBM2600_B30091 [Cupriavidus taiwanensis]
MDAPALTPAPLPQAGEGRKHVARRNAAGFSSPDWVHPLPLAGEGWGEGRSVNEVKAYRYCQRRPSPPAPLPQAGEGRKHVAPRNAAGYSNFKTPN